MDPLDFTGRVVVVTGGTRGLGAATAHAFQAAGAHVLVCARTAPSSAAPAPDSPAEPAPGPLSVPEPHLPPAPGPHPAPGDPRLVATGPPSPAPPEEADRPAFFQADVRDPAQAAALIGEAVRRFGRLDVLVNNAGGAPTASAAAASPRLHAKIIELNLIAPLHVSQAANAVMREQPAGGVILMIGSVSGTRPSPGTAAYGAAKAGLHHLATSLAAEWAPRVRVNSLVVGPVDNPPRPGSAEPVGPDREVAEPGAAASVARTVPMGRAASAGEVASACLLLASPLAGYITGASLAVHGGGEWPAYLADLRDTAYRAQK